jgi:hypothetical protein
MRGSKFANEGVAGGAGRRNVPAVVEAAVKPTPRPSRLSSNQYRKPSARLVAAWVFVPR